MILDSKGKAFGKVSIVDIIVVLLLIFAIVGAYFRFYGGNSKVVTNNQEFYYTISINNIRENNMKSLQNSIGTQFCLAGKIKSTMGELTDIEVSNAKGTVEKTDGTIVVSEIPERFDVKLTLKVVGNVNENGYYTPETYEICAAKEYNIKNIYCCVKGAVDKVWTK